mmetsp:Transcript_52486/g.168302  ORF Transcript_52486/g.168302 Transcript_52486/m.168302 type:complete len:214 (+) Transcript_52486:201-842(+)
MRYSTGSASQWTSKLGLMADSLPIRSFVAMRSDSGGAPKDIFSCNAAAWGENSRSHSWASRQCPWNAAMMLAKPWNMRPASRLDSRHEHVVAEGAGRHAARLRRPRSTHGAGTSAGNGLWDSFGPSKRTRLGPLKLSNASSPSLATTTSSCRQTSTWAGSMSSLWATGLGTLKGSRFSSLSGSCWYAYSNNVHSVKPRACRRPGRTLSLGRSI